MQRKRFEQGSLENTIVPQEVRKTSNEQPRLTQKASRERRTSKTQS